jgi:predicted RNase H-like HicB family nuclease
MNFNIKIIIQKEESNWYYASCPDLPGCFSNWETIEECQTNIREAVYLYLESLKELSKDKQKKILSKIIIDNSKKFEFNFNFQKQIDYA